MAVKDGMEPRLLEAALRELLRHHDALRLRFERPGGGWRQFIAPPDDEAHCARVDLSAVPEGEQLRAIEERAAELQTGLDLAAGPLLRAALFGLGGGRPDCLLFVVHHLAVDAVSWRVLLEDVETAYRQLARGELPRLPPKTTSFKRWSERLVESAQAASSAELDYWLDATRARVTPLPVDYAGGANTVSAVRGATVSLTEEETQAVLQELPKAYDTQINDVLLTALVKALEAWTGRGAHLIDLEGHGREHVLEDVDLSRTVGWFTAIWPVLLDVGDAGPPDDALRRVREQLRRVPGGGLGYGLLRYLSPDAEVRRRLSEAPRPEVSFQYLGQADQILPPSSLFAPTAQATGLARSPRGERSHLLEVVGGVTEGRLQMTWLYSENVHRPETVERVAGDFVEQLRALVAPCRPRSGAGYAAADFAAFDWSESDLEEIAGRLGELAGSD
jgi:non-ribosomal peptide synthase protein (TIGR01720 family)